MRNPREKAWVGDLVAVEMKYREHAPITAGVEKLVAMPPGGQRTSLRLPIADDAGDDQVGVVKGGAVRMTERIAQFAPLVNAAGSFGRDVAGNTTWKAELLE